MKVNFITEINGFYRFIQTRQLSSNAKLLWFMLFCLWNAAGFPDWLQVDMKRMMTMIQANSRSTAERARNELIAAGRLRSCRGKSRQPNRYQFVLFGNPSEAAAPGLTPHHVAHQSEQHPLRHPGHHKNGDNWPLLANPVPSAPAIATSIDASKAYQPPHQMAPLYKLNETKPQEKKAYGQFGKILLTDRELAMLKEDFPDSWEDWIRRVDLGKARKNYPYTNDYAAIHSWHEKDQADARDKAFAEMMDDWMLFHD